jgi:amino acid transporter
VADEHVPVARGNSFGWFKGVYTPSVLTILGVVMYLRLGWVLGNAGLGKTLLIVTLSSAVTFLTGLSIAAIATNMKVGIGGAYFIISRSLGLQAGAAVGLPLFFAQALGVSFYVVGFAEALCGVVTVLPPMPTGVVTLVLLGALAWRSTDLALRAQYFILAAILISLVSFFLGGPPEGGFATPEVVPEPEPFWVVFAVFFPAVTGIEAGVAMSGDLKNPSRALPWGTVGAVLTGYAVYIAIPLLLFSWVPVEVLRTNPMVLRDVAYFGPLILVGVWGASLSSALGALLGAPRTLQALARDRVLPSLLGRGSGPGNEPRVALVVAFVISMTGVVFGSLNLIAPVLSMFFLTSYAFLNLASALEGVIDSPSWRPEVRTPWWLSLAAAALCLVIMFMINAGATFIAAAVCSGVYYGMSRRRMRAYFGDMRHGLLTLLARWAIYRLAKTKVDEHSWRPNILVLSGSPTTRWHLIELANAMLHHSGFLTVACVVPEKASQASRIEKTESTIAEFLERKGVSALVEVHVDDDVMEGARALVQSAGIGRLEPNTVLLGETENEEMAAGFARLARLVSRRHKNLVVMREDERTPEAATRRRIDIWWGNERTSAGLMLALAYLLQTSDEFFGAQLRIFAIAGDEAGAKHASEALAGLVRHGRLSCESNVLVVQPDEWFHVVKERSRTSDVVLLPLRAPRDDESDEEYSRWYLELMDQTEGLGATAFVMAAEEIAFSRIFEE